MSIFKEVKGNGEDVVVLHGWGCDHRHMQPIVDELLKSYYVTNVDLPGRGQSIWQPTNQTIHDIADQLLADLPKKAIYAGWSFGGLISISIAARYPERIKQFVGITTTPKFIASDDWIGVTQPGFKASFDTIKQLGFKSFFKSFYDAEFAEFNPRPHAYDKLIHLLEDNQSINMEILFKGINICDTTDLRREFESLKCPVDLMLSEKDDAVPVAAFEKIKALNPNINIHRIQNAHHMPFWTHPDKFNKILSTIL